MATNDRNLELTELDFLDIKESLKTYLKSQSVFKDYDFEGSGLSVLLDVLSYNILDIHQHQRRHHLQL